MQRPSKSEEFSMSRNFELLTNIDYDLDGTEQSKRAAADRPAVQTAVPSDNCGDEILRLVQSLFLSTALGVPRQVVFCGVDGENGSSSVCASAGRTLATNTPGSVCLVDANVRSQRLSEILGVDTTLLLPGKAGSLRERCAEINENLWLAGSNVLVDNRGSLLPLSELKHRLAQLSTEFGYLLIDAPGASVSGDAAILGQVADAAVLVIEANSTRKLSARKAKASLDSAGVRVVGTVLHNRSFPIPESLYKRL
jgi:Mrp family chromosome partitioning ATPase